ncbi:DnaJ domain-containing protein [Xylaria arbuscula]|nr:DnaJ domain-containing protein [Xylaria arbuscula]
MVPPPITEDFYMILEVDKAATTEFITQSYKRLARKLHPDRNHARNATEAFQLLGKAYETLKDETKRRNYDLIYPSIKKTQPVPQSAQVPRPPPTSNSQPEGSNEGAQIASILKSKQARRMQWLIKRNVFDSSIFEINRNIRRLEQEIKTLVSVAAAVEAEEAQSKSWGTWLLSPIYKKAKPTEEEKALKERHKQERKIEMDMKERRLEVKKKELGEQERLLKNGQAEIDAADRTDDLRIRRLQDVINARMAKEREAREKAQREEAARVRKQEQEKWEKAQQEDAARVWKKMQEKWAREAREAAEELKKKIRREEQAKEREKAEARKRQEEQAAEQKRREEQARRARDFSFYNDQDSPFFSAASVCLHDGWWPKVQGRTPCPKCYEVWTYLLQCPGCDMKACPRCQAAIRPRRRNRPPPPRVDYDYFD